MCGFTAASALTIQPQLIGGREMENLIKHSAISFNLSDSEGLAHRLSDYKGNWLLMVFLRHLG